MREGKQLKRDKERVGQVVRLVIQLRHTYYIEICLYTQLQIDRKRERETEKERVKKRKGKKLKRDKERVGQVVRL